VTGRKRIQLGVVALAACLGGAALTVGAGAVAAFEQKATQAPQVQTPPAASPTPSPAQGRGGGSMDGRGSPGRGGPGGGDVFHEWEWWKDDTAKRELGLTDKVAADIDRFYQNRLRAVTPFIEEWRKQRDNLQQMTLERSVDESVYAVQDLCTHDGETLGNAQVEDCQIVCPRHGARFCLRTGEALTPPAYEPLQTFAARVENGRVLVELPS